MRKENNVTSHISCKITWNSTFSSSDGNKNVPNVKLKHFTCELSTFTCDWHVIIKRIMESERQTRRLAAGKRSNIYCSRFSIQADCGVKVLVLILDWIRFNSNFCQTVSNESHDKDSKCQFPTTRIIPADPSCGHVVLPGPDGHAESTVHRAQQDLQLWHLLLSFIQPSLTDRYLTTRSSREPLGLLFDFMWLDRWSLTGNVCLLCVFV